MKHVYFELHFENQSSQCRRPAGSSNPFSPKFTRKMVKHPQKVMAWGSFSWMGRGALEFLEKGEMMNGASYRKILDDMLELFMHQHWTSHFLQDGAACTRQRLSRSGSVSSPTSSSSNGLGTPLTSTPSRMSGIG